jgi:long-subunit acyl-CoA synthetase (AMP-forming)
MFLLHIFEQKLQGEKCGIYGANSPEWIITMEVILASLFFYLYTFFTLVNLS